MVALGGALACGSSRTAEPGTEAQLLAAVAAYDSAWQASSCEPREAVGAPRLAPDPVMDDEEAVGIDLPLDLL